MKKLKNLLNYNIKINLTAKDYLKALLFILLPNLFFWLVAYFGGLARPIINEDYLWISALIVIPFMPIRILAALLYIGLIFFDVLRLVVQWFPFMDLSAVRYLLPFISIAPMRYLLLIALLTLYILIMPILLIYCARRISKLAVWINCSSIATIAYFIGYATYHTVPPERFGRDQYFITASQLQLYREEFGNTFALLANTMPQITPYEDEKAIQQLKPPHAQKLLLIVNESWGVARSPEVQRAILQKLYELPNLEYIADGYFDFQGATVQGEMRELCQWHVENGYSFKEVPDEHFNDCLPNILKQQGYQTIAMHGSSSHMYDRYSWYQKAGFQKTIFSENLLNAKRCHPFNGVCDSALYNEISKAFKEAETQNTPILFYWLTLTSHVPYVEKDIYNHRLDCEKYELFAGDLCNNMQMQTQFFDGLAELLKKEEMQGTEILIVGDHMPPIMQNIPFYHHLRWQAVSWVHLRLHPKEQNKANTTSAIQ